MTERVRAARLPLMLTVLAAVVATAGAAVGLSGPASLVRDRRFAVTTPLDGASVGDGFLLAWAAGRHAPAGGYAVVVDQPLPRPGERARPGDHTMMLSATALRLTLGPATTGSPSARNVHVVQVIRLDRSGRRLGEDVAVVHVRSRR